MDFPLWHRETNPTRNHDVGGSIPGLTWTRFGSCAAVAGGCSSVSTWELPCAVSVDLKSKKKPTTTKKGYRHSQEFPGGLAFKVLTLSQLWRGFDPWPGNFCMPWAGPKKKIYRHSLPDCIIVIPKKINSSILLKLQFIQISLFHKTVFLVGWFESVTRRGK